MAKYYASEGLKIAPRRSVALFVLLAMFMVAVSYVFVVLLAIACGYLPYFIFTNMEHAPGQLLALMIGGIAGTLRASKTF